jgi:hypothetical protein
MDRHFPVRISGSVIMYGSVQTNVVSGTSGRGIQKPSLRPFHHPQVSGQLWLGNVSPRSRQEGLSPINRHHQGLPVDRCISPYQSSDPWSDRFQGLDCNNSSRGPTPPLRERDFRSIGALQFYGALKFYGKLFC